MNQTKSPSEDIVVELSSNKTIKEVVSPKALPSKIREAIQHNNELYVSYYMFPKDEINFHYKGRKKVDSYKGTAYYRNTVLDIDIRQDTDAFCLQRARVFANRLNDDLGIPLDEIIYFCSGRGYHFQLPPVFTFEPEPMLWLKVKDNFEELFPEIDQSPHSNPRGSLRIVNTINPKVNRYKIPLTQEEFFEMTWQEIHQLAQKPRINFVYPKQTTDLNLMHLIKDKPRPILSSTRANMGVKTNDDNDNIATCLTNMYNEGPTEGSRHMKLLRIASGWRRAGLPQDAVLTILNQWSTLNEFEVKDIVQRTYNQGYTYSCQDALMAKYCDSKCIFYKKKNYVSEVISAKSAEEQYIKWLRTDMSKGMFNLNQIWKCESYPTYPGEVVGITADTKLGKSTVVMNMLVKLKEHKSLYVTMENGLMLTYRRFIQIAKNKSREEVEEWYHNNNNSWSDSIKHIDVVVIPPSIDGLRKMIIDHKPQIVVIDSLEDLAVKGVDDITQKTNVLAPQVKQIAQELNVIIICILHMNKAGTEDDKGKARIPTLNSPKGSSAIKQKFDKMFAWYGERKGVYRTLEIMAARDESNDFKLSLVFDKNTMRILNVN